MSGIGNTIETDLVGEIVEVYRDWESPKLEVRGRVRAATTAGSDIMLWVEIIDEASAKIAAANYWRAHLPLVVGDIITTALTTYDFGKERVWVRIVRGQ